MHLRIGKKVQLQNGNNSKCKIEIKVQLQNGNSSKCTIEIKFQLQMEMKIKLENVKANLKGK